MKRIGLLCMALTIIIGCTKEKGYTVNGVLDDDSLNGSKIFISHLVENNASKKIDSTVIKDRTFSISLPDVDRQYLGFITIEGLRTNLPYITENESINFTIYKDSIRYSKISGGKQNTIFSDYISHILEVTEILKQNQLDGSEAVRTDDNEGLDNIKKEREAVLEQDKLYKVDLAKNNPNSLVAAMALTDLSNVKTISANEIIEVFSGLSEDIKASNIGVNLNQILSSRSATDIGVEAPEFSAPQPNGEMLALKDVLGKVTIIDFWASWCRPCRIENPNVVKLYNTYHDKGLNIIGVSLDKTNQKDRWIKAIEDDKLPWKHVSNLAFWNDPVAKLYNIRAIPATFILDENGVIVAKNLRGKALEDKMVELLN